MPDHMSRCAVQINLLFDTLHIVLILAFALGFAQIGKAHPFVII